MEKQFKGKAIYCPVGKAKEYAEWACNFYVGCSNGCTYCYLKKGRGAKVLGGDKPKLKACFRNKDDALRIMKNELVQNLKDAQKHGIFFSFTTDPLLTETFELTLDAVVICISANIPVKILTKCADDNLISCIKINIPEHFKSLVAIGYTLTGADELEPNVSKNSERIEALRIFKEHGFKTFASIEPIIDFPSSKRMILESLDYVDLFRVGLESGKKYNIIEAQTFVEWLSELDKSKIYLKESLQKLTGYNNSLSDNFVERDYNLFI